MNFSYAEEFAFDNGKYSGDPTPGDYDNLHPGDEYYDLLPGMRKLTLNIMDLESGYENQITGLRNPVNELDKNEFSQELLDNPDQPSFKAGIIGVDGNAYTDYITICVDNENDIPNIKNRLLQGINEEELKQIPQNYLRFARPENKATVYDLMSAENLISNTKDTNLTGNYTYNIDAKKGKVVLATSTTAQKVQTALSKHRKARTVENAFIEINTVDESELDINFESDSANYSPIMPLNLNPNAKNDSRFNSGPNQYGGAGMFDEVEKSFACTSGFTVVGDASGDTYGTTAAHCGENGDKFISDSRHNYFIGKIAGKNDPSIDVVRLRDASAYLPFIWTTGGDDFNYREVVGGNDGSTGLVYCFSGGTSGVKCNAKLVTINVTVGNWAGNVKTRQHLSVYQSNDGKTLSDGGDSGGPVYTRNRTEKRANVKGTIVGADKATRTTMYAVTGSELYKYLKSHLLYWNT